MIVARALMRRPQLGVFSRLVSTRAFELAIFHKQASRRVSTRHARVRALRLLDAFYDAGAEIVVDRSNATNLESGGAVQIFPLSFSSFTARYKTHHDNIQNLPLLLFSVP